MSFSNNNIPAFPNTCDEQNPSRPGMELWDYFAARAVQGCLANAKTTLDHEDAEHLQILAKAAFAIADAMLVIRERTP